MTEEHPCPKCGKAFEVEKKMKCHHAAAHGGRYVEEVECQNCGEMFPPKHNTRGVYCSHECLYDDLRDEREEVECRHCGKTYVPEPNTMGVYCSLECSRDHTRDRVTQSCEHCGDDYQVKRSEVERSRFCSLQCKFDHDRMPPKRCVMCDGVFRTVREEQKYCCPECFYEDISDRDPDAGEDPIELIRTLYVDEGYSLDRAYRRQRAILGSSDCLYRREVRETLQELGVFDPSGSYRRRLIEADPEEFLGNDSSESSDGYRYRRPTPESCPSCGHRPTYQTDKGRICSDCEWTQRQNNPGPAASSD